MSQDHWLGENNYQLASYLYFNYIASWLAYNSLNPEKDLIIEDNGMAITKNFQVQATKEFASSGIRLCLVMKQSSLVLFLYVRFFYCYACSTIRKPLDIHLSKIIVNNFLFCVAHCVILFFFSFHKFQSDIFYG